MALIIYSWGNKLLKKQFLGIRPCPQCGNMTEQYLKRQFFTLGIFYIPIIWIPTKRWYVCENCGAGVQIDKDQFKEMKAQYKGMPKKNKMLAAFGQIEAAAPALPDAERTVDNIYGKITENVKFTSEEEPYVREMIDSYLTYAAGLTAAAGSAGTAVSDAAGTAAPTAGTAVSDAAGSAGTAAPTAGTAVSDAGSAGTAAPTVGTTVSDATAAPAPVVVENPLNTLPSRGKQTVYSPQTVDGQPVVYAETLPVRKKKWGWLVAGIVQTFIMLFGLLMLLVDYRNLFDAGIIPGLVMILIFGIIPVGLTVLFFSLFAKK